MVSSFTPFPTCSPNRLSIRLASPFAANASSVKPIQPKFSSEAATPSHLCSHASAGMGRIVTLDEGKGMELNDIVAKVKELLGMKYSTCPAYTTNPTWGPNEACPHSPTRATGGQQLGSVQNPVCGHLRRIRRQSFQGSRRRLLLHRRDEPREFFL